MRGPISAGKADGLTGSPAKFDSRAVIVICDVQYDAGTPLDNLSPISETCEPAVCKVRSAGQPYRQKCRHFYALATDASGPVCILGGDDIVRRLTNAFRFAQRENFRPLLIDQKEASFGILDIDRRVDAVEERLYPVAVARFSRLSVLASDAKPQTLMP